MLLNDVKGKLAKCFLDPTDPAFIRNNDELCIALWGFYASYNKVQEHLLNQSIYVSGLCQVNRIQSRRTGLFSCILQEGMKRETMLLHHLKEQKRLFDCWCYVPFRYGGQAPSLELTGINRFIQVDKKGS